MTTRQQRREFKQANRWRYLTRDQRGVTFNVSIRPYLTIRWMKPSRVSVKHKMLRFGIATVNTKWEVEACVTDYPTDKRFAIGRQVEAHSVHEWYAGVQIRRNLGVGVNFARKVLW